jgi:hypothetical protein
MTAEVHSLGAYRELSGRPSVDTELAAIREKLNIEPPPPIPFRSRLATRLEKAWEVFAGVSDQAKLERQAGLLNTWFETTADACGIEQTQSMLQDKLNLAKAIIQARSE